MTGAVLYRALAAELRAAIMRGDLKPGARLPTEHELSARHRVSRHTAREAMRLLRSEGLCMARRGAGTIVAEPNAARHFSQTLGGVSDLLQYARNARLEVNLRALVAPDALEARALSLSPSVAWVRIDGVRRGPDQAAPIALTQIIVRADLCPPTPEIDGWSGALNELIAKRSGVVTARIDQQIAAVALTRVEARKLEAQAGAPALKTTRRYFDPTGALYQASDSLHPGDRFIYTMTLASE